MLGHARLSGNEWSLNLPVSKCDRGGCGVERRLAHDCSAPACGCCGPCNFARQVRRREVETGIAHIDHRALQLPLSLMVAGGISTKQATVEAWDANISSTALSVRPRKATGHFARRSGAKALGRLARWSLLSIWWLGRWTSATVLEYGENPTLRSQGTHRR